MKRFSKVGGGLQICWPISTYQAANACKERLKETLTKDGIEQWEVLMLIF